MACPNIPSYVHATDADDYVRSCAGKLSWGSLSDDIVMDVGCGKSKYLCDTLVKLFPSVKQVIAIDKDVDIINQLRYDHGEQRQIEFHVADIETGVGLERWVGGMSKVLSTHCFHQVDDKQKAFKNVYKLLKSGGDAGIMFSIDTGFYRWCSELLNHPKYSQYYQCKEKLDPAIIEKGAILPMLEQIGFKVIFCSDIQRRMRYSSDDSCIDIAFALFKTTTYDLGCKNFSVPEDMMEEFKQELFRVYLRHNTRNDDGYPCDTYLMIQILAKKLP